MCICYPSALVGLQHSIMAGSCSCLYMREHGCLATPHKSRAQNVLQSSESNAAILRCRFVHFNAENKTMWSTNWLRFYLGRRTHELASFRNTRSCVLFWRVFFSLSRLIHFSKMYARIENRPRGLPEPSHSTRSEPLRHRTIDR